jgi:branched-chain amino acid transport system ATP-binding protein
MALLSVEGVTKAFGGLIANNDINFAVEGGEIKALIGPNGAGKTTLFNVISGFDAPTAGRVVFAGCDIAGLRQDRIASLGLTRTYQLVQLFRERTAAENVAIGFHLRSRGGILAALWRSKATREQERRIRDEAHALLAVVGLDPQADLPAGALTYGQQRLLELARALATGPKLLLLDEPAAGLTPPETEALGAVIHRVNRNGVTILLIEHDMGFVMTLAQSVVVLDFGRKIAEGTPAAVQTHPDVMAAYLGDAHA